MRLLSCRYDRQAVRLPATELLLLATRPPLPATRLVLLATRAPLPLSRTSVAGDVRRVAGQYNRSCPCRMHEMRPGHPDGWHRFVLEPVCSPAWANIISSNTGWRTNLCHPPSRFRRACNIFRAGHNPLCKPNTKGSNLYPLFVVCIAWRRNIVPKINLRTCISLGIDLYVDPPKVRPLAIKSAIAEIRPLYWLAPHISDLIVRHP